MTAVMSLTQCPHDDVVPVTLIVTGEHVANLCGRCLRELPLGWNCADCEFVEERRLCDLTATLVLASPCRRHVPATRAGLRRRLDIPHRGTPHCRLTGEVCHESGDSPVLHARELCPGRRSQTSEHS